MNYLGLISVCLGLIAVFIAIQYMNTSEKMFKELKNIRTKCINVDKKNTEISKILDMIRSIKDTKDLDYDAISKLLYNSLNKKEGFRNYEGDLSLKNTELLYSAPKSRGIIENNKKLKSLINYNRIGELSEIINGYEDLFKKTFSRIQNMDKPPSEAIKTQKKILPGLKNQSRAIPQKLSNQGKNYWCKMKNRDKSYCFLVPNKTLCMKGKLVNTRDKCDFY